MTISQLYFNNSKGQQCFGTYNLHQVVLIIKLSNYQVLTRRS